MFAEISIPAVNQDRHKNVEFANVFLAPQSIKVSTDPFEVAEKGTIIVGEPLSEALHVRLISLLKLMDLP